MKHPQEAAVSRCQRLSAALLPLLILSALVLVNSSAAQMATDMPLQFKIRGEFYDPQENPSAGGVNRFTVNAEDKEWILDIERSDTLEGSMLGSSVLKKIYPPIMTFMGPPDIMAKLKNPEIQGKTYTMTGQLYIRQRLYRLTSMVGDEEQGEAGAESKTDLPLINQRPKNSPTHFVGFTYNPVTCVSTLGTKTRGQDLQCRRRSSSCAPKSCNDSRLQPG